MDNIKIGNFIKELRLEKGWSQEELASKLYISRQSVSKWENGQTAPSMSIMIKLAEIFDVTVTEVMTGEKATTKKTKEITSTTSNEMIKMHKETKKVRKISFVIIFVLLFAFLGYYFFSSYRSQQIYSISGESENFTIMDGLYIQTKTSTYLSIQNIKSNEKIVELTLYYLDNNNERHDIQNIEDNNLFITDYLGYSESFNESKKSTYLKNLYLEIKSANYTESIKLNFLKLYENDELLKLKDNNVGANVQNNHEIDNDRLIKNIKTKFKKENNNYIYSINNKEEKLDISFNSDVNNLYIIKYTNNIEYSWTFNLNNKLVQYQKIDPTTYETIEKNQDDLSKNVQYINEFYEILNKYILDSN